ncbi:hypothetical protein H3Z83_03945 [Tenacibaculum sp. S7007]|uniref:Uncharacterized protein n=1 Tax=Tenacibaculum pelagium TaxID=2759527 RepID=A0A839AKS2_9FLAO|nr:hypothetical protein [Tenacibaculum pelagium]MBA6155675.1 hypothetical protein [Tenacibaculum pelagium]
MNFEVVHEGRGGCVKCLIDNEKYEFKISCENPHGYFGIWIRGVDKNKKDKIKKELRNWLNSTGRNNWYFE